MRDACDGIASFVTKDRKTGRDQANAAPTGAKTRSPVRLGVCVC